MLFNWAIGLLLTLLGVIIKTIWDALTELRNEIKGVHILVAGDYVRRSDHDATTTALFAKLDRIEDKIDRKADK